MSLAVFLVLVLTIVGGASAFRQTADLANASGTALPASKRAAALPVSDGPGQLFPADLKRLVVYGHSIPSGVGASKASQSYAVLAAASTGLQLVNHAYGGTLAASAAKLSRYSPPAGPRDAVVIHTGLNDVFKRGARATAVGGVWIREMLEQTARAGRRVLVLECQPESWAHTPARRNLQQAYLAWNDMLRNIADNWPNVDLLRTCAEWDPTRYTDATYFHPNDDGHALLAADLAELLRSGADGGRA